MGHADPIAIVPRTFAEAMEFAKAICASSLVPQALRDNAPNTMMMILAGAEIGVPPIASMRMFHVIEGVPKLSADGIAAICTRDPSCEYLEPESMSSTSVTWIAKKRNRPEKKLTITRQDMIDAGLYERKNRDGSPGNHQKYPRQMLNARCKAELCRLVWPDRCAGMVSSEEHADELGIDINGAIDAQSTERKPTGFSPLPTNTNAPKAEPIVHKSRETMDAPKVIETAEAGGGLTDVAPDREPEPAPSEGPLTDDDVAILAGDMKQAAASKDSKELSAIGAYIAKLGARVNESQWKYLAGIYGACRKEIAGAKP